MSLATIKAGLVSWVSTATGLSNVIWANQNAPRPAYPYAVLQTSGLVGVGMDETRWVTGAQATPVMTPYTVGQRQFTLGVQILTQSQNPASSAEFYGEKLRDLFWHPSTLATLGALGVKPIEAMAGQDLSGLAEDSLESRYAIDFRLASSVSVSSGTETFIESVEVTGTVDGDELDTWTIGDV